MVKAMVRSLREVMTLLSVYSEKKINVKKKNTPDILSKSITNADARNVFNVNRWMVNMRTTR